VNTSVSRRWSWGVWACLLVGCSGEKTEEFGTHARGEPAMLSDSHSAQATDLALAVNGSGQALVYWRDFNPGQSQLQLARYTPGLGWEQAEALATAAGFHSYQVAIDDSGNALATWTEQIDSELWRVSASRFTAGADWSAPEPLEDDVSVSPTDVALSMNSDGRAMAVWSDIHTSHVVRARAFDPEVGWGSTETIGSAAPDDSAPAFPGTLGDSSAPAYPAAVVLCHDGSALAMWGVAVPELVQPSLGISTQAVFVNRYAPGEGWGGAAAASLGTIEDSPRLRCDDEGRVAATWAAPAHPQMSTFFAREAASNAWQGGLLYLGSNGAPMALTPGGDALVVLNNHFENGPVEALLNTASAGLVEQKTIEAKTDGEVNSLDLAANAAGKALAVWARAAEHGDDIWINTRQPETGWGQAERLVGAVPRCGDQCSSATSPRAAMDAAGNTIVAWIRRHDSHADVVAQVLPP